MPSIILIAPNVSNVVLGLGFFIREKCHVFFNPQGIGIIRILLFPRTNEKQRGFMLRGGKIPFSVEFVLVPK